MKKETIKKIRLKLSTYITLLEQRIEELKNLDKRFKETIEFYQKEIKETKKILEELYLTT